MRELRNFTIARVGLGRTGNAVPTRELLDFQLAHARARDAVHLPLDLNSLQHDMHAAGGQTLAVHSAASSRDEYLRRPDLGRRLNAESRKVLEAATGSFDAAFVVADGLSALAIHRHAVPVLTRVVAKLDAEWNIAPIVLATQGRVALGDEIGILLNAKLVAVLIGERPGLSSPDSLGIYVTWDPRPGRTDAERNCISNVRTEGLSYDGAAARLIWLLNMARHRKLTGVALKENSERSQIQD